MISRQLCLKHTEHETIYKLLFEGNNSTLVKLTMVFVRVSQSGDANSGCLNIVKMPSIIVIINNKYNNSLHSLVLAELKGFRIVKA